MQRIPMGPKYWIALAAILALGAVGQEPDASLPPAPQENGAAVADEPAAANEPTAQPTSPEVEKPAPIAHNTPPPAGQRLKSVVLHLEGPIDWARFTHFRVKLQKAQRIDPDLLVVVIDSPGGLLEESLEMGRMLADVDWATTVVYVPDKALSGAAILSLGADRIVIGPQGRFGDAGVISLDDAFMWQYVEEKMLSDVVRRVRDLAERKGHAPELAEAMVDRHAVVFQRPKEDGTLEFRIVYASDENVAPEAPAVGADEKPWTMIPETMGNRFLELNAAGALNVGLAEPTVGSLEELLQREGADDQPIVLKRTTSDAIAYWLTRPLIRVLLILIALVSLYFELSAPGISAGGIIATLAFGALFWSSFMSGLAGALEILLFLGAFAMIAIEIFVIPGMGIAGITGALMLICSLVLIGQAVIIPESNLQWRELANSIGVVTGSSVAFVVAAGFISHFMGSIPVLNRMMLPPPDEAMNAEKLEQDKQAFKSNRHVKVGDWGETLTPLRPAGKAQFGDVTLDVLSDGDFITAGVVIQVMAIQGNRIVVAQRDAQGS